ncbi:MAG TPA: SRPBCC family protein [Labilithrix sp.]|nr:SRPBCC family protein [Labilithrix sp.]
MALQDGLGETRTAEGRGQKPLDERFTSIERRARKPSDVAEELTRVLGWIGVCLGLIGLTAPRRFAKLIGIGPWRFSRRIATKSRFAAAATTVSGAALVALFGTKHRRGEERPGVVEVERSITIRRSPDELYRAVRDPKSLERMMAHFADVRATTPSRVRWTIPGPLRTIEWETEVVHDHPGELVEWESIPGAAIKSTLSLRFRPAPEDWGSEARLRLRIDPGNSRLRTVSRILGGAPSHLLATALHRFKSLVETGEVPTIHRQPAARNGGRDN